MGTTQSKPGIFPSQPVSFKFEGISYQVTIQDVRLFPQGYSAIAVHPELIRGEPSVLLMDVGGWTVDLMRLDNGIPNASACRSLELGMIRCIDEAKEQVRRETGLSVTDAQVEHVLANQTKSVSRFARNTLDCIHHVRLLKSWGIPVIFEKEGIDTSDMNSEMILT